MKGFIYGLAYFLIIIVIFSFFFKKTGETLGIEFSGKEKVFISKDGGKTWSEIEIEKEKFSISEGNVTFSYQNPSLLYLASNRKIFETKEKEIIYESEESFTSLPVLNFFQNPKNPNIFYLILDDNRRNKVLISYDKGKSFKSVFISGEGDKITVFKIDPILASSLYIGTKKGMFLLSNDSGKTWQKKQDFSPQAITDIGISPIDRKIFLATDPQPTDLSFFINPPIEPLEPQILLSEDNGNNFIKIEERFDISNIDKIPAVKRIDFNPYYNKVYFMSDDKIFFSKDNKLFLLDLIFPTKNNKIRAFTIDPQNPNIIYVGAGNLLYLTKDDGLNWEIIEPPVRNFIKDVKINPQDSNIILLSLTR